MSVKVELSWFDNIKYMGGEEARLFFRRGETMEQRKLRLAQLKIEKQRRKGMTVREQQYEKYKDLMKWLLKGIPYIKEWKCTKLEETIRPLKNGKKLRESKYKCGRYEKTYTFYSDMPDIGCIRCQMSLGELWICDLLDKTNKKYIYRKKLNGVEYSFYVLVGDGVCVEHHNQKHYVPNPEYADLIQKDRIKMEMSKKLNVPYIVIEYGKEYGTKENKYSLNKELTENGEVTAACLARINNF